MDSIFGGRPNKNQRMRLTVILTSTNDIHRFISSIGLDESRLARQTEISVEVRASGSPVVVEFLVLQAWIHPDVQTIEEMNRWISFVEVRMTSISFFDFYLDVYQMDESRHFYRQIWRISKSRNLRASGLVTCSNLVRSFQSVVHSWIHPDR